MGNIDLNSFFDKIKNVQCKHCNPSPFAPIGLYCTCGKKNMPDDGGEIEARVMAWNPTLERLRAERGLPRHVKCDCGDCAKWRAANYQKIMDLDWDMKPVVKRSAPSETTRVIEDPDYLPALSQGMTEGCGTDWDSVKARMDIIKQKRLAALQEKYRDPQITNSLLKALEVASYNKE